MRFHMWHLKCNLIIVHTSRRLLWIRKSSSLQLYDGSLCYNTSQQERSILIVGDGDLSYSASIALSNKTSQLVATVLESEADHRSIYSDSSRNIDIIRKWGHQVRFQVDARDLSKHFDTTTTLFDRIQWNFPHDKGRTNARNNRDLIKKFFASSKDVLNPNSGQIHVALFEHQGGAYCTSLEYWKQSWMPARYAGEYGLLLLHVYPFEPEYKMSSYQWKDKPFRTKGRKHMYIFSVADGSTTAPRDLQLFSSFAIYTDPTKLTMPDFLQVCIPHGIRLETSRQIIESSNERFVTFPPSALYTAKYTVYLYGEKMPMTQQRAESLRIKTGEMIIGRGRVSSWNASHVKPSSLNQ